MADRAVARELQRAEVDGILADSISALLHRYQTTQVELGYVIGLPEYTMSKRMKGIHQFYPFELVMIAAHFGVPIGHLFERPKKAKQ